MRLGEMLAGYTVGAVPELEVAGLQYDSRRLHPGEAFFAFPGERVDGHDFVPAALQSGAAAIVSEREAPSGMKESWARVSHGRRALAMSGLRFYERPDRDLKVTAVTGTNGKTSTVHLLDTLLQSVGKTTAVLGTIEQRIGDRRAQSINTTPESLDIIRSLAELRQIGGSHVTMEASSHALALERIYGIEFHTAVFTNLSPEHLDFHGDMESYAAAKRRLFVGAGARPPLNSVINADDELGKQLLKLKGSQLVSYGRGQAAGVRASEIEAGAQGVRFDVSSPVGRIRVESSLIGAFNVDNMLAATSAALCHGLGAAEIEAGLMAAAPAPGRFETVDCGQPFLVVVDYAHTPDALHRSIEAAREIVRHKDPPGRVLTLFGCGGDRDRTKRAPMGNIAGTLSDFVMLTSDNPRSEDPLAIIQEVVTGLKQASDSWTVHPDRAEAIKGLLYKARCQDIVLIAGKGHETTQTTREGTLAFDDRQAVRAALHAKGYFRA